MATLLRPQSQPCFLSFFGISMPQILCFVPKMNLLGCAAGFIEFDCLPLQQQRFAKTRRNAILSVKLKQKVALDHRDATKQWA